jgi:hypothetical protein
MNQSFLWKEITALYFDPSVKEGLYETDANVHYTRQFSGTNPTVPSLINQSVISFGEETCGGLSHEQKEM